MHTLKQLRRRVPSKISIWYMGCVCVDSLIVCGKIHIIRSHPQIKFAPEKNSTQLNEFGFSILFKFLQWFTHMHAHACNTFISLSHFLFCFSSVFFEFRLVFMTKLRKIQFSLGIVQYVHVLHHSFYLALAHRHFFVWS